MYKCDKCKEIFYYKDEMIFLCGDVNVETEECGGSGDIGTVLCIECYFKGGN